mmetsp:Transcript_6485/g.14135  ORF Transcript_6485/g.14135 Transcript_6485/m.14135 type:complete len:206 (-) Transcript_6485:81-698(-)
MRRYMRRYVPGIKSGTQLQLRSRRFREWPTRQIARRNRIPIESAAVTCNRLPITEGTLAAAWTSGSGEKTPSSAKLDASCTAASAEPSSRPMARRRDAAARAARFPAPSRLSSAGTTMEATVETAKRITPPSCHSCIATACAAAPVPVASRRCVDRVTATKATFRAIARICTATPPLARVFRDARDGILSMLDHLTRRRLSSSQT